MLGDPREAGRYYGRKHLGPGRPGFHPSVCHLPFLSLDFKSPPRPGCTSPAEAAALLPLHPHLNNTLFSLLLCSCPQATLQALELLLIRKYIPQRSFYIALGHDEEVEPLHPAPTSGTPTGQRQWRGCGLHPVRFAPQLQGLRDMVWWLASFFVYPCARAIRPLTKMQIPGSCVIDLNFFLRFYLVLESRREREREGGKH